MKQILIYGDSPTWGMVPNTRTRLDFDKRWPGILEQQLLENGSRVRIFENCLNGRRTAWEDPFKAGRNGLASIAQCMEICSPVHLLIFLLGTNDFQSMHTNNIWHSAYGMTALVRAARSAPVEIGMSLPQILIVAPPAVRTPRGNTEQKFLGADKKCMGHAMALEQIAGEEQCHFFDAGKVIETSESDGVHLEPDQHPILAREIYPVVKTLI